MGDRLHHAPAMDLELQGKRALVTGGSRGIGKAVARGLAREGAAVAILARDAAMLATTAGELANETGATVVAVVADTTDDAAVERAVAEAAAALGGGIDILVNAAAEPGGYAPPPKLAEIDAAQLQREIDVKVMGYLRCARAVAPFMQAQRWGRIVNVSGLAARQTGSTLGSIRNVAVSALTKNLADELGPSGINVTVVHPGVTRTERTAALIAARAKAQGTSEDAVEKQLAEGNAIRHLVEASEVANVVVFLCSPKAVAIQGDAIAAGGGAPKAIHY
jgi:NAD(P)-dependent dehydrogenase (short-subunit alcohol dehydrogenase family)